ncbi:MAG TPA: hypothetical protein VK901_10555 [Nitrospiraceae bacterium]|nr:hypothetical protein [Nitrospiraceae bacterium]
MIAALLANPQPHIGKVYHLTGPQSATMHFYAHEYSKGLGRTITFHDIPVRPWRDGLLQRGLPIHPSEPPRDHGRSAPRGTLRPDVRRRAHANWEKAVAHAGVRQEECVGIHRVGKSVLSV